MTSPNGVFNGSACEPSIPRDPARRADGVLVFSAKDREQADLGDTLKANGWIETKHPSGVSTYNHPGFAVVARSIEERAIQAEIEQRRERIQRRFDR